MAQENALSYRVARNGSAGDWYWEVISDQKIIGRGLASTNYNYRGAIKFGLRAFFNDHSPDLVPNSAMYAGNRIFIAQV
jgi:hypothetical protein